MDAKESRDGVLEEASFLNSQITAYIEQRNTALGLVSVGVGGILALSPKTYAFATVLALFSVIIAGALMTYNSSYQALRRVTYITVFIEPFVPGLKYYTRIRADEATPYKVRIGTFSRVIAPILFPSEYALVYLMFGVVAIAFAYSQGQTTPSWKGVLCFAMFAVIAVVAATIHMMNTVVGYRYLERRWKQEKEREESEHETGG